MVYELYGTGLLSICLQVVLMTHSNLADIMTGRTR